MSHGDDTLRVPFEVMNREFERILFEAGLAAERAALVAGIFTQNSCDGVASHGYNRILAFVESIRRGEVRVAAEAECLAANGAWERWDGNLGPGMLNALKCSERVMELADAHGVGCVSLRNTNHWMRPGFYGWRAAEAGYVFMCWTNTEPNMPPWGGSEPRLGNNPLVIAVPGQSGPVVLDMAMSQFSFGTMELYKNRNLKLPLAGGYDSEGKLTVDPGAILASKRSLPIGYWKGAGLSLLLDLVVTLLADGRSSYQLGEQAHEYGVSQVFLAFDVHRTVGPVEIERIVGETLAFMKSAGAAEIEEILYPGERVLRAREENLQEGIPIEKAIWDKIIRF